VSQHLLQVDDEVLQQPAVCVAERPGPRAVQELVQVPEGAGDPGGVVVLASHAHAY
jgi:hypothetical protein